MERNYKLYVHISPSGKRYYGITSMNPKYRWNNGKGYKNNKYFTSAIVLYGWDNFQHEILFNNLTENEAKLMEQCYIALYDTTNREKGYNITLGGEGTKGIKITEETRKKMSESMKGENNPMFGKTGKNSPMYGKGYLISGKNNPNYGKHRTKETRQKISKSNKGKQGGKNHPQAKNVICITTGRVFFTAREAEKYYNIKGEGHISSCCRGKRKSAGKLPDGTKLIWKYLNYKHNKKYRVVNNKEVA